MTSVAAADSIISRVRVFFLAVSPPSLDAKFNETTFDRYLEFSMSQHGRLGEAVPALHQVNHIKHGEEGQGDVDVATGARALQVQDVVIGRRGGVGGGPERYGGGAENGHPAESTPSQCSEAAIHEESQEEALPVGLPTQGGGQRLLEWPLLWKQTHTHTHTQEK